MFGGPSLVVCQYNTNSASMLYASRASAMYVCVVCVLGGGGGGGGLGVYSMMSTPLLD